MTTQQISFPIDGIVEVKSIDHTFDQWEILIESITGNYFKATLYTYGGEPCPFEVHQHYQTVADKRGGWNLKALGKEEAEKLHKTLRLKPELWAKIFNVYAESLKRVAVEGDVRCNETQSNTGWTIPPRCVWVRGHAGTKHMRANNAMNVIWDEVDA